MFDYIQNEQYSYTDINHIIQNINLLIINSETNIKERKNGQLPYIHPSFHLKFNEEAIQRLCIIQS